MTTAKLNNLNSFQGSLRSVITLFLGASASLVGVVIPELDALHESTAAGQAMLVARFSGSLLGTLIASYFIVKKPLAKAYLGSLCGASVSFMLSQVFFSNLTVYIGASFFLGIFTGSLLILLPAVAINREAFYKSNISEKLMFQQAAFGAGAAIAPLCIWVFSLFVKPHNMFGVLSIIMTLLTILSFIFDKRISLYPNDQKNSILNTSSINLGKIRNAEKADINNRVLGLRRNVFILILVLMAIFIYAGLEHSLNSWLLTWLQKSPDTDSISLPSLLSLSFFWFGLFIGRLLVSLVQHFKANLLSYFAPWNALVLCAILVLIAIFPSQTWLLLIIAIVIGPLYPALVLLSSKDNAKTKYFLALVSVAGNLGAIIISAQIFKVIVYDFSNWYFSALALLAFSVFVFAYIIYSKKTK